jgi:hypothetical protein
MERSLRASAKVGARRRSHHGKTLGIVDMHAGRLQGSRLIPSRWRVAELPILFIFGLSVLDLPVHLVHHLGEVDPDCQLLGLAVSLNASSLDGSWLPTVDCTWDELLIPVLLPSVALRWESAQARAPPSAVQS